MEGSARRSQGAFIPKLILPRRAGIFVADNKAILKAYRSDGELAGIVETDTERSKGAGVGWISLCVHKKSLCAESDSARSLSAAR